MTREEALEVADMICRLIQIGSNRRDYVNGNLKRAIDFLNYAVQGYQAHQRWLEQSGWREKKQKEKPSHEART